jgi:hypothetical protein
MEKHPIWKSNAQECFNKLCDELLGKDYYIGSPVSGNQANEIITQDIIDLYKPIPLAEKFKRFMHELVGD